MRDRCERAVQHVVIEDIEEPCLWYLDETVELLVQCS